MDLESEEFMTLLTDALRAGPASPEWHQAVGILRTAGAGANVDEMQLLVRAREDLESGREYRAVKAGPGFTRKVLAGIEEEKTSKGRGLPSANLVLLLAVGVILAVVVVVAVSLVKNPPDPNRAHVDELNGIYLVNPAATLNFEDGTESPPQWRTIGEVPLKVKDRHLAPSTTQPTKDDKREYKAGAIVLAESIGPDQARMIDATLRVNGPTEGVIPEVFVAEGPIDNLKASSARELAWLLKGGIAQAVLPDGSVLPSPGEKLDLKKSPLVNVKIRFNKDTVIVESGDRRVYEGPHNLSATAPRYVGVRFLRKVGDGSDGVWLLTVNVLKP
jgi:hypothetical protein